MHFSSSLVKLKNKHRLMQQNASASIPSLVNETRTTTAKLLTWSSASSETQGQSVGPGEKALTAPGSPRMGRLGNLMANLTSILVLKPLFQGHLYFSRYECLISFSR